MYSGPPGRSEFPGGAASGVQKSRDGVPIWNGDSQYFEEFAEACLRYEQTVVKEKRYLCGPRIASELRGPAKRVLIGKPAEWLSYEGGVRHLLAALRSERGQPKVPELSNLLLQYFKGTRRQKGESMSDYVTRKAEAYTRAQQSLARYQTQQSRSTSTSGSSRYLTSRTPTGRRSSSPDGSLRSAGEGPQIASTGLRRSMEPNIMEELNEQGSLGEPWEARREPRQRSRCGRTHRGTTGHGMPGGATVGIPGTGNESGNTQSLPTPRNGARRLCRRSCRPSSKGGSSSLTLD